MHNEHTADVMCMAIFEGDGNIFITGSSDLTAKIWDIRVKQPVQNTIRPHDSAVNAVAFFPGEDPTNFVTGSDDSTIKLHDLRMKDYVACFEQGQYESVYSVAFSKTGRFLFAGTENCDIKVWDILGNGEPIEKPFKNHLLNSQAKEGKNGLVKTVAMSCDGYSLAYAGVGDSLDGVTVLY